MVAAHTQRPDSSITDLVIKGSDILDAFFEAEATSEWHITDIGYLSNGARGHAQLMVIGPDPLDLTHRPWAETRPRAIGHPQIHRDTNERHIETCQVLLIRRIEQGWDPGIRQFALPPAVKETRGSLLEGRIKDVIALGILIFLSQSCKCMGVDLKLMGFERCKVGRPSGITPWIS
jgi:hypothetical protein